jgi:hypothetical protein
MMFRKFQDTKWFVVREGGDWKVARTRRFGNLRHGLGTWSRDTALEGRHPGHPLAFFIHQRH